MVNCTKIKVRYAETDQMGIVHHSNYIIWFEVARTEYMNSLGMSYGEMEKLGYMLPVVECHCEYKSAAKYEDEVIIAASLKEMRGARALFNYEVKRQKDGKLLALGTTVHAITDSSLRPINLEKKNKELYDLLTCSMDS